MSDRTINIKNLQIRGDTSSNFTSKNPVLKAREFAVETDTKKVKVGDGSTAWKNLPYWGAVEWDSVLNKPTSFTPTTHNHDDRYYTESEIDTKLNAKANNNDVVHLAGAETITGNKTFSGNVVVSDVTKATYTTSNTANITPSVTSIANPPWNADLWHDHFAFMRYHTVYSQQTTTDGTTWTTADKVLNGLFSQHENTYNVAILNSTEKAYRFTLKNTSFAYSSVTWFELAVSYSNPFSKFKIKIEYSTGDNSSGEATTSESSMVWTTIHESDITTNSLAYYLNSNTAFTKDGYLRFTFTKTSDGSANLKSLKAFATRKGDQGLGSEYEYPYVWDYDGNISPIANNTKNLGSASVKWNTVYATTFNGNATSSTTASKLGTSTVGSTTQAIYLNAGTPTAITNLDFANTLITSLPTWTANPTDNTYFIRQDTGGSNQYGRVKASTFYDYVKGKLDSVYLGISGKASSSVVSDSANALANTVAPSWGELAKKGTDGNYLYSTFFRQDKDNGSWQMATKDGQLFMQVDGKFYQREGVYPVLDSSDIGVNVASKSHTHTKSDITDFPTIPTVTDTYSSTSSNAMSGKAVASALSSYAPSTGSTSIAKLASTITLGSGDAFTINQNGGTWWQRLKTVDTADKSVKRLVFEESQGTSGASFTELFAVDGNGNAYAGGTELSKVGHTHSYLPLSGGTLTGTLQTKATANTWIGGLKDPAIWCPTGSSANCVVAGKTKDGRIGLSWYPSNDNKLHFIYGTETNVTNSTNSVADMTWDGPTNTLTATTFVGSLTGHASSDLALSGGTMTGTICLNRVGSASYGRLSYYSPSYYTWYEYMQNATIASPTGAMPATIGNVTTWAQRSLIENTANYGWVWESCANSANAKPVAQMGLSSNTGDMYLRGSMTLATDKVTMQYNETTESLDFVFA